MLVPESFLTCDPGLRNHFGWAYWWQQKLLCCGIDDPPSCYRIDLVLTELPQVYPGFRDNDANDLISISIDVGLRIGRCVPYPCPVQMVKPRGWKGGVPKETFTKRILKVALTSGIDMPKMLEGIPKGLQHNAIDAVGLGLWKLRLLT